MRATTWYDYDNQAWVEGDRYAECGHRGSLRTSGRCCFAGRHAGDLASDHLTPERLAVLKARKVGR